MVRCKRIFGLGMGYVQALILALPYSVDSLMWHNVLEIVQGNVSGGGKEGDILKLGLDDVKRLRSVLTGMGRVASLLVIQKVNCKFLLLGVTVAEVVFLIFAHSLFVAYGGALLIWVYMVVIFMQGTRFPFSMNILAKWTLTRRMTSLYAIFEATKAIVISTILLIVHALIRRNYSAILLHIYVTVALKIIFCVLWTVFGAADPMQSMFVSLEELAELRKGNPRRIRTHWKNTVPWRKIFATPILYGCVVFDIGNMWAHEWEWSALIDPLTMYLEKGTVMALVGSYFHLLACVINAFAIDYIIKLGITTVNNIRKTTATITSWGSGVCFLLIGYTMTSETSASPLWVTFFHLFKIPNFYNDAALIVYALSPNYFGFNYGFVSAIAYLSKGLQDRVESALLQVGKECVLYFYCLLMMFSCLTMLLSGDCDPREFDSFGTIEWKDESFVSFP